MNIDTNFFKRIYNEDIIYHYTKASTAIDFILHNNQLKFGRARNSFDPTESRTARRGTTYYDLEVDKIKSKQQSQDANELHAFVKEKEEQFHQICFCQNKIGEDFASDPYISNFKGHEELFGFTKLRMWDQYADRFSGVCIALSKEKVLSLNSERLDIVEGNVNYLPFHELSLKKIGNIQGNHLINVGKDVYKKQLEQMSKQAFFQKHIDYEGETEYRIGTFYDKDKCSFESIRNETSFDKTMMLDIKGCITAIFISSFANERQKKDLLQYAYDLDVEIVEMRWQYDSFEPRNYKKWMELVKKLTKNK